MHSIHEGHVDEHVLEVTASNPASCTPQHLCTGHAQDHQHGENCGHESVPHGDHVDYLVGTHLHHVHGSHCDDHGTISLV